MANAKKCDICGTLYESPICNDAVVIYLCLGYDGECHVDLCNICYGRLCDFVKPALPKNFSVKRRERSDKE
jgi:hypothetical protein